MALTKFSWSFPSVWR